ncbi:hypothetical protein LBWT_X3100 (plasmid) [Leptolyngbya boryana IAM M-101]|nr:hypothetical protein LBWT_X3100 [Leptolyngbya boryana IAM M-101]BAS66586.1 hypothetical protein LBDG_X3100 [Leptolyngbya boryana dg5]
MATSGIGESLSLRRVCNTESMNSSTMIGGLVLETAYR